MDHTLSIDAQVTQRHNYTITRTSDEATARILAWYARREGLVGTWELPEILDDLRAPTGATRRLVLKAMKAAQESGEFAPERHVTQQHNLVPSVFRNALAAKFAGNAGSVTFEFDYLALGSDSTAAMNSDVLLGNETMRAAFTDRYSVGNVTHLDLFLSSTEVGGDTFLEAGAFSGGSLSADTGTLGSRVVINEAMGVNENLTINVTVTVV